ncbi:aggregative adherence fimbria V major subunit Agg5A [Escherichia coli]|nr:aggregative adherence fimbria V major subunit Agg5A [Escherichia coli]
MKKISIIASLVFSLYSGLSIAATANPTPGSLTNTAKGKTIVSSTGTITILNSCSLSISSPEPVTYTIPTDKVDKYINFRLDIPEPRCKELGGTVYFWGADTRDGKLVMVNGRDRYTLMTTYGGVTQQQRGSGYGYFRVSKGTPAQTISGVVSKNVGYKPGQYTVTLTGFFSLN